MVSVPTLEESEARWAVSAAKNKKTNGPCFLEPVPTKEAVNERYIKHNKNGEPVLDKAWIPMCVNHATSYVCTRTGRRPESKYARSA